MGKVLCNFQGCKSSKKKKGYCRLHYRKVFGEFTSNCKFEGCKRMEYAVGYCFKHGREIAIKEMKQPPISQNFNRKEENFDYDNDKFFWEDVINWVDEVERDLKKSKLDKIEDEDDDFWDQVIDKVDNLDKQRSPLLKNKCSNSSCDQPKKIADMCLECYKKEKDIYCCVFVGCYKNKLRGKSMCGNHCNIGQDNAEN